MQAYTLIDTQAMPWESMPGIPGFKRRLLHTEARTGATIEMQYSPPGFTDAVISRFSAGAVRHFHRTVTERHYFLAGDLPNCDWRDLQDTHGQVTVYRRHSFLDRPPMSLHGLLPGHVPAAGAEYLVWNTGSGTALWESSAQAETVEVSEHDLDRWRHVAFSQPRILRADRLPLHRHPSLDGWRQVVIAPDVANAAETTLVIVPANSVAKARCIGATGKAWMFVLCGDLFLTASTPRENSVLELYEGSYLNAELNGTWSLETSPQVTDRGCTILTVGLDFVSTRD